MNGLLTWPFRIAGSLIWYAWQFVIANLEVTREIVTPGHQSDPVVVRYPTRCETEIEISLLNLLISLTPGTLPLATEEFDGPASENDGHYVIYVHAMFQSEPDEIRHTLRDLEDHALAALRPHDQPHTEEVTW